MKKIILILLIPFILYANSSNECGTDLYYANGVLMDKEEDKAKKYWDNIVDNLKKDYPELRSAVLSPKIAYNASELGGLGDFLEAFFQWSLGQSITLARMIKFQNIYIKRMLDSLDSFSQIFNVGDLGRHIKSYKDSIKQGREVIVVAHSQGNFI